MPADTQHAEYAARAAQWARCRAAFAGQDAVHAAGTAYLPKLSTEQIQGEYDAYKLRASWYGASGRTLDGMVGMVFRKAPLVVCPDAFQPFIEDVTLGGVSANGLAREVLQDTVGLGRIGALVEHPQVQEQPSSLAQASAQNLRPYATLYRAESIINWKTARVNNAVQPVQVVLLESFTKEIDAFKTEQVPQIRELRLDGGKYLQRLYRQNDKKEWIQEGGDIFPLKGNKPLEVIPFFPFGPEVLSMDVQQSPLLDLVDVNLSHYRTGADLEHGAHFTGLPTPFISGVTLEAGQKIKLGSSEAIVSAAPEARATYMEFTGQGLESLEKLLDRKEKQMAALGARMLAPEKAGVEASATLSMRHNGEDSVLAGIAALTSIGLQRMLAFMAEWAGIAGEISYTLNTDYMPKGMTAQELAELVKAWQSGAISYPTLFENLQRGEVVARGENWEDEKERIDAEGPPLGTMGDDTSSGAGE